MPTAGVGSVPLGGDGPLTTGDSVSLSVEDVGPLGSAGDDPPFVAAGGSLTTGDAGSVGEGDPLPSADADSLGVGVDDPLSSEVGSSFEKSIGGVAEPSVDAGTFLIEIVDTSLVEVVVTVAMVGVFVGSVKVRRIVVLV